ncbi:MAG: SPOR domain-containing protein [Pyrinomonadaceae bacterium]
MKAVCQKCKAECLFETGSAVLSKGFACARCGEALDLVLWSGNEPTTLSLSTHTKVKGKSYTTPNNEMAETLPELSNEPAANASTVEFVNEDSESSLSANASPAASDDLGITSQDIVLTTDFDRARQRIMALQDQHLTEDTLSNEPSVAPNIKALRSTRAALSDYENSSLGVRLLPISPVALFGIALVSLLLIFILDTRARQQKQAMPLIPVSQAQSSETSAPAQQQAATESTEADNPQPAPTASAAPLQAVAESSLAPLNPGPVSPAPAVVESKKEEAETVVADKATTQTDGKFTIQVGSYPDNAQAQERIDKLSSGGLEARVVRTEIPKRGTWYRVQVGRFLSREEAARVGSQLRSKGTIQDFVVAEISQ